MLGTHVQQGTLRDRIALADLCNERGIKCAVEIGTDRGLFARDFLARWRGMMLHCVDPWEPYPHMPYDRTLDMLASAITLAPYVGLGRCRLIRARSPEIARYLAEFKPGFVYIDGDHNYDFVAADIEAWWPILPSGGILAGHDYCEAARGVRQAVDEFAEQQDLIIQLTNDSPASWYTEKP